MKTLYLDLFSGISGDMFVGALIDLGVSPARLERELRKLGLDGYHLHVSRARKSGIEGIKFDVHVDGAHHEHGHGHAHSREHHHERHHGDSHSHEENRTWNEIRRLITRSRLSSWVKQKSLAVFQRIAEAEGRIHGLPPEQVHFHEVGALDSIVDIVGACIGLELLGKPRVLASPVIEGIGWVDCAHGRFPVPAPATLAILGARGIAVTQCDEPHELVTPTGAALLAEFAESFGPMEGLAAERIGFGLGTRENRTRPNVLRAILAVTAGKRAKPAGISSNKRAAALDWETDTVAVLETNLDDISAEILGGFVEKAFNAGALDVFHTPIQMKKNRPGVLLTVLCAESQADAFTELILRETSAFGVRRSVAERRKLRREIKSVKTRFGEIAVKLGLLNGKVVQAAPEYESCRKAAQRANAPLKTVYSAAVKALKPNL
ncbi:MAG TPA: nickel pincer cofactor biosynthesis protein LarC [Verrucomicrobia bacterium]|nr:nickel pincer cofactor biosynthesis protein LarC [Verrucomicrobiota bacterium]HOP98611.1 nickel pincer cofactor biosynthesis protein LarC [Verrucomicrobiota bacterium]HPU55028.1 nickel pincer cofactor biosynthesis protein LarC [Verrucomicrobiota bacterium]